MVVKNIIELLMDISLKTKYNDLVILCSNADFVNSHQSKISKINFNKYNQSITIKSDNMVKSSTNPTIYKYNKLESVKPIKKPNITEYTMWFINSIYENNKNIVFNYTNKINKNSIEGIPFSKYGLSFSIKPTANYDTRQL